MDLILHTGVLIFLGYLLGEVAARARLPKVSGYIIAGILLNPDLLGIVSPDYLDSTTPLINATLAVITFSIGGSLKRSRIRAQGRTLLMLTLFESVFAYVLVFIIIFISLNYFVTLLDSTATILAVSLILASLAAPTDPSATLAVMEQYQAKGPVSSSIMGIAAFDDITGIIMFTFTLAFSKMFMGDTSVSLTVVVGDLGRNIGGAVLIGALMGLVLNLVTRLFQKDSEGSLIVATLGTLLLCYGVVDRLGMDALLATMTMGAVVINYNGQPDKIFELIERYTDELVFVVFFTLSAMHLRLSALSGSLMLIGFFALGRAVGKYAGIYTGSLLLKAPKSIARYAAAGLLPQGGVVIGLALLVTNEPLFESVSGLVMGIVIGATIVHELLGPIAARYALVKAGEIKR